jgi:hypothetical protein
MLFLWHFLFFFLIRIYSFYRGDSLWQFQIGLYYILVRSFVTVSFITCLVLSLWVPCSQGQSLDAFLSAHNLLINDVWRTLQGWWPRRCSLQILLLAGSLFSTWGQAFPIRLCLSVSVFLLHIFNFLQFYRVLVPVPFHNPSFLYDSETHLSSSTI